MRPLACVAVLILAATLPATGQKAVVLAESADGPYIAPKAEGAVVELLDEGVEPLFPQLMNEGSTATPVISREDRDVFAGVEAIRVTPLQKYLSNIPGWNYKIVEKPAAQPGPNAPAEYRYLRFAWKKIGGTGIMIQFNSTEKAWIRYFAGQNVLGRQPATSVAEKMPGEWTLVTCDLFMQCGAITLTGVALSPFDGDAGLFDHVLLGRSVEDLDNATNAVLGKVKPAKPLVGKERDAIWIDLIGADAKKAASALRAFLATAPDQVAFIRNRFAVVPDRENALRIQKLLKDLDAEEFDVRETSTDELIKLGTSVLDAIREAGRTADNDEVRYRCRVIQKKLGAPTDANPVDRSARLSRAVRVLERAGNTEARAVLAEIAQGKLAPEIASDAKAALTRMTPPKP